MNTKDMLRDIKALLEASSEEMKSLKAELSEIKIKMHAQSSRLATLLKQLEEMKEAGLNTSTLIEEIAYCVLEENTVNNGYNNLSNSSAVGPDKKIVFEIENNTYKIN